MDENTIDIPEMFEPLFECFEGLHPQVERVIITGGRESSKTFTSSLAICDGVVNHNHRVLYTRYTLKSAEKSIIPAFENRASILGYGDWLTTTGKTISTTHNKGKIDFAGFKVSSGNQTATLKSLEDYSVLIMEEAEEFPNFEEYEKVDLSLRSKDVVAFSVLILNPTSTSHWIYEKYFSERGVKSGHNGIVGDTLYIHSTYLDLGEEFVAPKNWRRFEAARKIYEMVEAVSRDKRKTFEKKHLKTHKWYSEVVLGGWKSSVEGINFPDWGTFKEWPDEQPTLHIYGLDWGYANDPAAFVEVRKYGRRMYVKQHIYQTGILNRDLADMILDIMEPNTYLVADSAEAKSCAQFQKWKLYLIPAKKGPGSIVAGIKRIQDCELFIHEDSKDIIYEANNYHSIEIINSKGEKKIHPVDKDNHAFDAVRYADSLY